MSISLRYFVFKVTSPPRIEAIVHIDGTVGDLPCSWPKLAYRDRYGIIFQGNQIGKLVDLLTLTWYFATPSAWSHRSQKFTADFADFAGHSHGFLRIPRNEI